MYGTAFFRSCEKRNARGRNGTEDRRESAPYCKYFIGQFCYREKDEAAEEKGIDNVGTKTNEKGPPRWRKGQSQHALKYQALTREITVFFLGKKLTYSIVSWDKWPLTVEPL